MGMAPTDDTLDTFRRFMPECCIFNKFSQEKLERMLALQRELIRRGKKRSVLLILDDCMYQKGVLKSTAMRDLFFNGRHLNCSLIVAAQYLMEITPELRTNIDYLCVMREPILTNRQKMHKYYFGQFAKYDDFEKVMQTCTQNYGSLILDGTTASTQASDSIFWYRANLEPKPFQLCLPIYWKLSQKCARSEEDVRRAQSVQFEIESAERSTVPVGGHGRVTVVQTEDENGKVVSSSSG